MGPRGWELGLKCVSLQCHSIETHRLMLQVTVISTIHVALRFLLSYQS